MQCGYNTYITYICIYVYHTVYYLFFIKFQKDIITFILSCIYLFKENLKFEKHFLATMFTVGIYLEFNDTYQTPFL